MANLLGVPSYDPTLDREVRQFNSELLQNLGKQIRQDVTTIQTNRQLQGLAQGLQQVDPATPQFGKSVINLMTQYPLATKTPIGQAAISQLGAEHKFWQQEQLQKQNLFTPIPGADGAINRRTGEVVPYPAGTRPARPVQVGKDTRGIYDPSTKTAIPVEELGLPVPPQNDPFALEDLRHKNRKELKELDIANKPAPEAPEIKRLGTQLNRAMEAMMKKDAEAARLETAWANTGDSKDPTVQQAKWELGTRATALRKEAQVLKGYVEQISSQIKGGGAPAASQTIPGISVVEEAVLMPEAIPVQPTLRQFKYMTGQGAVPK